jgi:hypothetical protein
MSSDLSIFAARLREFITLCDEDAAVMSDVDANAWQKHQDVEFNGLALVLFALQFKHNPAYRRICEARGVHPDLVVHWSEIPAVPTRAFKELEMTCLSASGRTRVFHSSGTTGQIPSRHFHCAESLEVYEASLWAWFRRHVLGNLRFAIYDLRAAAPGSGGPIAGTPNLALLTPGLSQAPHSSLVHMFETVRRRMGAEAGCFMGTTTADGSWVVDFKAAVAALRQSEEDQRPLVMLGTAFSLVQLLDYLVERGLTFELPAGSRAMETGGYKGRSRSLPRAELHEFITKQLGISPSRIVSEYGMSELGSQAYDGQRREGETLTRPSATLSHPMGEGEGEGSHDIPKDFRSLTRFFRFPPWARVRVTSPETGREAAEGETGLLRVFDLANVFSVMAVQTEDMAIRRGDGFEWIGRAEQAEPRGCSLMAQSA